jgi:hypothetical protein
MMRGSAILRIAHPDFGNDHDLLSLWGKYKRMLPTDHPALEKAADIERILGQFTAIDPKSMDTRYGLRRDLKTSAVEELIDISVSNLSQTINRLQGEFRVLDAVVESIEKDRVRQQNREL